MFKLKKLGRYIIAAIRGRYYFHLLFVLFLWSLAMTFDYYEQVQEANYWAARHEQDFVQCLKGKWRTVTPDGTEWGCMEVQYTKPRKDYEASNR